MIRPRPLSSLPRDRVSLGCPQLDAFLGGGLPVGSLTELVGEPGASKTQICLQTLLTATLPRTAGGMGGSAVYVYTEGEPAMKRLRELASLLCFRVVNSAGHDGAAATAAASPEASDPTAHVFVEKGVHDGRELLARLGRLRTLLAAQARGQRPVRLLVIDSVGHVLRELGGTGGATSAGAGTAELAGRTELLFRLSAMLRRYADEFKLAVLCVNQITDCVARGEHGRPLDAAAAAAAAAGRPAKNTGHTGGLRLVSLGREVVPALGLAWANCVNTRLFLSRCSVGDSATPALYRGPRSAVAAAAASALGTGGAGPPPLRRMQVVFAPHLPQRECFYVVEQTGVRGLRPEELQSHAQQQQAVLAAAEAEQATAQREREAARQQEWEAARWQQQQQQSSGQHLGQPEQQRWQRQHAAGAGPLLPLHAGQPQQWQQQLHQQPSAQEQLRSLFMPQHMQGFPPQPQQLSGGQQWQQGVLQERPTNWQQPHSWHPGSSGQQCHPGQQPRQQRAMQ